MVKRIEYRNLAPLYVDEEMKICFRRSKKEDQASVWIENKDGGIAVKGTVELECKDFTAHTEVVLARRRPCGEQRH